MEIKSRVKVKGVITFTIIRADGTVEILTFRNLVVNGGTAHMATLLSGGTATLIQYIALGSDNTPVEATDTALGNELYRKAAGITLGTGADANKVTYEATWAVGAAQGTIREVGLFDSDTGGLMFARTVIADVDVGPADTLIVSYAVSFAGA